MSSLKETLTVKSGEISLFIMKDMTLNFLDDGVRITVPDPCKKNLSDRKKL